MSNVRDLRLSIERKLKERRDFIQESKRQRRRAEISEQSRADDARLYKSELFNLEMEHCADEIVQAVVQHAIEAAKIVAEEAIDNGEYHIGISIPSLHIRRALSRRDMRDFIGGQTEPNDRSFRTIHVDTAGRRR